MERFINENAFLTLRCKMEWLKLAATEQESYIDFHRRAFEEDLKHAEKNLLEFPRWSIISGYYAMHDVTKLFLAKRYNIKLSSPEIHAKAIKALEEFVRDDELKKKLMELLREANDMFYSAERLKERILPVLLRRGKQERAKHQYYTEDYTKKSAVDAKKGSYFLEKIVKPYIKLIKGLME